MVSVAGVGGVGVKVVPAGLPGIGRGTEELATGVGVVVVVVVVEVVVVVDVEEEEEEEEGDAISSAKNGVCGRANSKS